MAREEGTRSGRLTIIALDPGEKHTGVASIELSGRTSIWRSGVIQSGEDYLYPAATLDMVFRELSGPIAVACEDYHVRPVGHQAHTRALTVRLIGAIEYLTGMEGRKVHFYPPGNIERDLEAFGLARILEQWDGAFAGDSDWEHARSAWRILGYYLVNERPDLEWLLRPDGVDVLENYKLGRWPGFRKGKDLWAIPLRMRQTE